MLRRIHLGAWLGIACLSMAADSRAAPPAPDPQTVARRVDERLAADLFGADVSVAPRCDDATFLRRAWLDIVGDIPPPDAVLVFAADGASDKRQRLVRDLLAKPEYGVNWARYWRDVIMYRRLEDRAQLATAALERDLAQWLNDNDPWDEIATKFITASGDVRENGATALIMAQEARTEETTAEVARIFLGIQIQCAQCHDHPYDRWKREEFHELAAFFPRIGTKPVTTGDRRSFMVFANDFPPRRRPNNDRDLPKPEHFMPDLEDPAAQGTRMQPKFFLTSATMPLGSMDYERRGTLAECLCANEWFAKALVNRLWAELVGEGFYEPVDDLGPDREASAPAAIDLLAHDFQASGCDIKWLIETICATEAYQRESRPRRIAGKGAPFAANVPQPLRGDQLYSALLSALDLDETTPAMRRRQAAMAMGPGRIRGPRGPFNDTFGYDPSDARDSIAGSIPQVLAMMNSPQFGAALNGYGRGVVARLVESTSDDAKVVGDLYLRTLSREPTAEELATATAYIKQVGHRRNAVADLTWALLNSAEFRYRR
jgi:hypothetical protein